MRNPKPIEWYSSEFQPDRPMVEVYDFLLSTEAGK